MEKKLGKINMNDGYINEKIDLIIRRGQNIKNIQSGKCHGLENESLLDLEGLLKGGSDYILLFIENYKKEEK